MRHTMRANHATSVPSHHVVLDTETVPDPLPDNPARHCHRFRLGVARRFRFVDGKATRCQEEVFREPDGLRRFVLDQATPKFPLWVWSHNAGFDLTAVGVWRLFETGQLLLSLPRQRGKSAAGGDQAGRPRLGCLVTDDPPTIIHAFTPAGASVWFVDTLNWFLCPLKELGHALGLPKLELPGEVASDEDWEVYCRQDVAILAAAVTALLSFVQKADLGNFRATAASQALALFRHRCMDRAIHIDTRLELKELERAAYYGGRREVYFAGANVPSSWAGLEVLNGAPPDVPYLHKGPTYHLDLTAAYPAAMKGLPYPVAYLKTLVDPPPDELLAAMGATCAAAHVRLDTGLDSYPVRRGQRVFQATGSYDTTLCGPELLRALKSRVVRRVHRAQLYTADMPFDAFVEATWRLRVEAEAAGHVVFARLAKLLANSLHGKFAQRAHRWELLPGAVAPVLWGSYAALDADTGQFERYRSIAGAVQRKGASEEHPESFPLIAAYCSAYCRERMYDLRWIAGLREVLYEDADSLHVTQSGYDSLAAAGAVADGHLGGLRLERGSELAVYFGPRDYRLGAERVLAGLGRKAYEDERGVWHQTNFDRLDCTLNGPPPDGPMVSDVTLSRPVHPIQAAVTPEGWTVPILLRE